MKERMFDELDLLEWKKHIIDEGMESTGRREVFRFIDEIIRLYNDEDERRHKEKIDNKTETINTLKKIMKFIDEIIEPLNPNDWDEAINWSNLSCTEAIYGLRDDGEYIYTVTIERASPGCSKFREYIRNKLEKEYPDYNFYVQCEW